MNIDEVRTKTLAFIANQKLENKGIGHYRYSSAPSSSSPSLYSSCYAVMTRSLYNDLGTLSDGERKEWIAYFNRHQDDDGLFRDPVIFGRGWYEGDPFWCGRPHLTCHVLTALACLGGVAEKPFALARDYAGKGALKHWLESRQWRERIGTVGNEIMNLGNILQYARDFHEDRRAGELVEEMLNWLDTHHLNKTTGLWGNADRSDPRQLSNAVQAAYHWWAVYFYDRHPIPCLEQAVDSVLATQNPAGGFGWGVHNPAEPYKSSACEDIDSIDPLCRMAALTDYRRDDIFRAIEKAVPWVLTNQMPDGGFVFYRDRAFEYGHPALTGEINSGAMFPTWFRTLSLAIACQSGARVSGSRYPWHFVHCPGYQFFP